MKKYIIQEVPAEQADLSFYFDDDGFSEKSGDYNNTLFIVYMDHRRVSGLNSKEYITLQNTLDNLIYETDEIGKDCYYSTYKEAMEDYGISYNPKKCHEFKDWIKDADSNEPEDIAQLLTFRTGKKWVTGSARGYCQGDYVDLVYCEGHYTEKSAQAAGEVWLGAAKEFCTICIDENGNETDTCYGFIVADCEAFTDEDYKRLVCNWDCLPEEETELQMIDGKQSYTSYSYRIA